MRTTRTHPLRATPEASTRRLRRIDTLPRRFGLYVSASCVLGLAVVGLGSAQRLPPSNASSRRGAAPTDQLDRLCTAPSGRHPSPATSRAMHAGSETTHADAEATTLDSDGAATVAGGSDASASSAARDAGTSRGGGAASDLTTGLLQAYVPPRWLLLGEHTHPGSAQFASEVRYASALTSVRSAAPGSAARMRAQLELLRLLALRAEALASLRRRTDADNARREAVQYSTQFLRESPGFSRRDEIAFRLCLALLAVNDREQAVRAAGEFESRDPNSVFLPLVNVALAESAIERGDLAMAARGYDRALSMPALETELRPFVRLRRAQLAAQLQQTALARRLLVEAWEGLGRPAAIPDGGTLRDAVVRVWCMLRASP